MTNEQLKKISWLERAEKADKSAERQRSIYESKKADVSALKKAYKMGGGGNSAKRNAIEAKMLDMLDAERAWHEKADNARKIKEEILSEINKIDDKFLADILKVRYTDFKTHERTAELFHYSVPTVKRLHKKALDALKVDTP